MTDEEWTAAEAQDATERRLGREADRLRVAVTSAATVLDNDDQQPAGRRMGDELRAAHEACEVSTLALVAELRAAREKIHAAAMIVRRHNNGGAIWESLRCSLGWEEPAEVAARTLSGARALGREGR